MKKAFLQSIREEYPNEQVTRLVFADWCAENEPELEEGLRVNLPNCGFYTGPKFGNPRIYFLGDVNGDGRGYGNGFGNGFGNGHGFGYRRYTSQTINIPKLYHNQLIFLPYSFVFCGYVAEHIQPYQFRITNASMIRHNSSTWAEVANNTKRVISYKKFGTITIGPQFFHSMDWIGVLP